MKETTRAKRKRKRPLIDESNNLDTLQVHVEQIEGRSTFIRRIEPYLYTFSSFCKARWSGRTILDVFSSEFQSYPVEYYQQAIPGGRIQVSTGGKPPRKVDCSYILQACDSVCHTVHRHEPAVQVCSLTSPFVSVVAETEELLVVDKPCTMPVHPCGGYHQNALIPMLLREGYPSLHTIHRLDRLTSGLVILGKNSAVTRTWANAIRDRSCRKLYLARVKGRFPLNCTGIARVPEQSSTPKHGEWQESETKSDRKKEAFAYWIEENGNRVSYGLADLARESTKTVSKATIRDAKVWLHLACPLRTIDYKNGINKYGPFDDLDKETYQKTVKPAQTAFSVLKYHEESETTVVLCRPDTGRTHQIRLHLQALGHPIANDPNYGGEMNFGTNAKSEESDSKLVVDTPATPKELAKCTPTTDESLSMKQLVEKTCVWCARTRGHTHKDRSHYEFGQRSQGIWLHALEYSLTIVDSEKQTFSTAMPEWNLV